MSYNTNNPVPSNDVRDLSDNIENIDRWANSTALTATDRFGVPRSTLEGVLQGLGFYNVGTFTAGKTLTNSRQVLTCSNGHEYGWTGTFPKVVAAGSTPTPLGSGGWIDRSDVTLRGDLAADESQVIISGETAENIALVSRGDDYTIVSDSVARIGNLFHTAYQSDKSVVITGDSLSFVGFGYQSGLGINGAGYATDNPFGMSSWAHMLRDSIFTSHPSFVPAEKCQLDTTASISGPTSEADFIQYGINSKVVLLDFASTSKTAQLLSGYPTSNALIVSYAPSATAALFNVNGVACDNTSPNGYYGGRGFYIIPFFGNKCTITNVRKKSDGTAAQLAIYGCGSSLMSVPKLTGKGGWTSGQILSEYPTLVAPYAPDVIYYIIGANDIDQSVPVSTFSSNVTDFISAAKSAKPNCEIVLLSTPPSSSYTREKAKGYIKEMRDIAETFNLSLIDLWSKLEDLDPSEWRFDNIHFNTPGDTTVFDIIRKLTFKTYAQDDSKFIPTRELYLSYSSDRFYYGNAENTDKKTTITVLCGASPSVASLYPSSRGAQVDLSYITINGKSALLARLPSGSIIESMTPLVRYFGASFKLACLFELDDERSWKIIAVDASGAQVDIQNSDTYLIITASLLSNI